MKVVIDATAAVSGGKVYLDFLLTQLAKQTAGHEFIIFHTGDFAELTLPPSRSKFHFFGIKLPLQQFKIRSGASILRMLWRLVILPLHLQQINPDIIFLNGGFGPAWKNAQVKSVVALHNSMPLRDDLIADERSTLRRWRLRLLRRLIRRAFYQCDGSIIFSEDTKRRVLECFGGLKHDPSVVHHGVDWGKREREIPVNPAELLSCGVTPPYLLYVSQFHRYKNVIRLLEAFALLSSRHAHLTLALVGEAADRAYWREIDREIARLGLSGRVKYLPACPREQLISIYCGALAFVHPSLAETCSFPLLEALALGLPVAAARLSALPEIGGDAAVYFDPYQPRQIAEVLDRLIRDETLRGALSRKAIARSEIYSWEVTAQQTMKVLEKVFPS
jgi:glycosyltransferase involved in cell wall biosynthesis